MLGNQFDRGGEFSPAHGPGVEVQLDWLPRTNHFGFRADSAEQVLTLRQRFDEAGETEVEFQEAGPTRVQVFDPDGYRVEVYAF